MRALYLLVFHTLIFSTCAAFAAGPPQSFRPLPEDFADEFQIGNLDGLTGRIAFTVTYNGFDRILALDIEARKIRKLVDGPGNNSYPTWSPDGGQLAFTSDRDGNREIYLADHDGESLRRLTKNPGVDDNADFAPDGKSVVFYSTKGSDEDKGTNLFSVPVGGGEAKQITDFSSGKNSTPRWSPDGAKIAYSTNRFWPGWDICVWDVKRGKEECILSGTRTYCRPAWSPSGKLLAYSFGAFNDVDVGFMELANKAQTQVSSVSGREYDAAWMPDGKGLVFSGEVSKELFNLFVSRQFEIAPLLRSKYSMRYLSWSNVPTLEVEARRMRAEFRGSR